MKAALALLLLALAAALAFPASLANAQIELIEADPPDGARLEAPPADTATPEETLQPDSPIGQEGDDDDGPDILLMALLTTAGIGSAVVLFTLGYLLRRRIGYEPHRPPEDGEEGEGH